MTEKKKYLLDTNILMNDPKALFAFDEHEVYIHNEVVKELDKFKKGTEERNINARRAMKYIKKKLNSASYEEYSNGIELNDKGGKLFFINDNKKYEHADPAFLEYLLSERNDKKESSILITNDNGLYVQAKIQGFKVQDYRDNKAEKDKLEDYTDKLYEILKLKKEIELPYPTIINDLMNQKKITLEIEKYPILNKLHNNQYGNFEGTGISFLYQKNGINGTLHHFDKLQGIKDLAGISPKNKEQEYLTHLCNDDNIKVGAAIGKAGTGKTLISLAAGIKQLMEKKYKRIIIVRPVETQGKELGAMPGDYSEKIKHYMGAIFDNSEVIFEGGPMKKGLAKLPGDLDYLISQEKILFETPTYLQGRSFPNSYIVFDEAQNTNQRTIKSVATRVGNDSKLILSGDPFQILNPYIDESNCGLVSATKAFLGTEIFSSVVLYKGERSKVAELAAELL